MRVLQTSYFKVGEKEPEMNFFFFFFLNGFLRTHART